LPVGEHANGLLQLSIPVIRMSLSRVVNSIHPIEGGRNVQQPVPGFEEVAV
jgi:hypothetical protein